MRPEKNKLEHNFFSFETGSFLATWAMAALWLGATLRSDGRRRKHEKKGEEDAKEKKNQRK